MTTKRIFSRRVAYYLRLKGFKIVRVEPNIFKPQDDVYHFEDTPALRQALTDMTI